MKLSGCPCRTLLIPVLALVATATLHAQGWQRWYHLPPRHAPRIVGQPSSRNDPPGGMILRLHIDQESQRIRDAVRRFRQTTALMATQPRVLAEEDEADLRQLLDSLGDAAVQTLLETATASLDLPPQRPID